MMTNITEKYLLLLQPWGLAVDEINEHNFILEEAFQEVEKCFTNKDMIISNEVLELMLSLLEHNNIIFYKNANYSHYQRISEYLFNNLQRFNITDFQKNRFFAVAVYSDYFMQNLALRNLFEESLIESCNYFKAHPKDDYDFLSLIHTSQYYLFIGKLDLNILYLEKAHNLIEQCSNHNYKLFFLYHYAWSAYEKGNYICALTRVNKGIDCLQSKKISIALHFFNIKASILYKLKNYPDSLNLAEMAYKKAIHLFAKSNQDVVAESILTIARNLIMLQKYEEGLKKAREAIILLDNLFGGNNIDPSQAAALSVCADAYMELNQRFEGKLYYNKALYVYKKIYGENISYMPEVKFLESKLKICI